MTSGETSLDQYEVRPSLGAFLVIAIGKNTCASVTVKWVLHDVRRMGVSSKGAGFRTALYSFTDIISLISGYPKIVKKQIVNFYTYTRRWRKK